MIWLGTASGKSLVVSCRRFGPLAAVAGCLAAMLTAPSAAVAQHVILKVNGEVITDYDIDQRTKFLSMVNHKNPSRKEVIEDLIDDKLKAGIARRYKIDLTDKDVDEQYADRAKRMHLTVDQLTQVLASSGVDAKTFKAKLLADLSWLIIIRSRFKESLQVSEKTVNDEVAKSDKQHAAEVGYDYTMRPILFLVPRGNTAMLEARRKDADVLRARFLDCDTGLPAARAQHDVVIREPITKNSSDLVPALREILSKTEVGHLTPPETTEDGVSMFALCDKKATPTETPEKRAAREKIFADQFDAKSKSYLRELRRQAMIERTQ
jgi:peptidyl-prolyl cis-trans isomerase SurA